VPVLLVCVDGNASDEHARVCRDRFEVLRTQRWTCPPAFVDQVDDVPVTRPGDLSSLHTVGVCMALPEPEDTGDENAVRRDVAALIGAMSDLAKRAGIEFVVEYREEAVGLLDGGNGDARFVTGFFGDA
jgi:hypothetical protein